MNRLYYKYRPFKKILDCDKKAFIKLYKDYHEMGYSYSGMQKALYWHFELRHESIEKANGGIGIIPGAMLGGFFIGIVETMVAGYGSSLWKDAVVYIILILILIIKPAGLLGKNTKEKV